MILSSKKGMGRLPTIQDGVFARNGPNMRIEIGQKRWTFFFVRREVFLQTAQQSVFSRWDSMFGAKTVRTPLIAGTN
jgi:hypothetical protein